MRLRACAEKVAIRMSRVTGGRDRKGKKGTNMKASTIKRVTTALVAAAMLSSSVMLTACLGGDGANENGGTKTKATDHDDWTTVADSSGRVWSTVVKISPSVGTDLDEAKLVDDLRNARAFDWERVICTDNRSTNQQEHAYLLMRESSDYGQIESAVEELGKKGWKCSVMNATAYEEYTREAMSGSYEFAETTYEK